MKFATYNIWNDDRNFKLRLELLVNVIKDVDVDIVALQEVRSEEVAQFILSGGGFKHYCWQPYPDNEEGLAILSKYPIIFNWNNWDMKLDFHNSGVINCSIFVEDKKLGITNVHLDYESALSRELEILNAVKRIEEEKKNDYEILLGDFNTYPISSIHGYLTGTQSLLGHSTGWFDLHDSYSKRVIQNEDITLDFNNNPRWDNDYVLDLPGRFDWILLLNPYPNKCPILKEYKLIGDKRVNGITPSDHYGVLCELEVL